MPVARWDELSTADKVDALRRELDAAEANERGNVQARTHRFGEIDKRLRELEEASKQIQSRLDLLERKNQP